MAATYLPEFISLAIVHFLAVIAPGPDFAVTVSQSVRHGRRVGLLTALGIGSGISVHVGYTLLGVGALLHASASLMLVAKLLGCAYLIYLAGKLLCARPTTVSVSGVAVESAAPAAGRAFAVGFLTNATNPKATLFFLSIFTTMVSADTPLTVQTLYGVWMCVVNAVWFAVVSLLFSKGSIRAAFVRLGHWFERMMGLILALFAVKLLLLL